MSAVDYCPAKLHIFHTPLVFLSKIQDDRGTLKTREWKTRHQTAGLENARTENSGNTTYGQSRVNSNAQDMHLSDFHWGSESLQWVRVLTDCGV